MKYNIYVIKSGDRRQQGAITQSRKPTLIIIALAMLTASVCAEDFKTINGKEYKNATVTRVEPDGIGIRFSGGVVKLPFTELPDDVRKRYNYDASKAAAYVAEQTALAQQAALQAEIQKQQQKAIYDEQMRQMNERLARLRNAQAMADEREALKAQEQNLLMQIGQAKKAQEDGWRRWLNSGYGSTQTYTDPSEATLPLLENQLRTVQQSLGK
jgi:hypothetical protein